MRLDRLAGAAVAALVLAIAPGALRSAATPAPAVERAPVGHQRVEVLPEAPEVAITPPEVLDGVVASPTAPAPTYVPGAASTDGEVFALLIGIDDYPGQRSDLRSAVADIDTIDAALAGFGVPSGNRVALRDGQATSSEVRAAVRSLVLQGGPGATYVFGYAGHVRKLDRDTEALVLADGALLRDSELAALVAPAATQRMWFLLATCYAAGFIEVLGPGRVLTAAAGANELAWEDPTLNASYLVHYLVREGWLEGKAGDSVQQAFAYADAALARHRPNRRPEQIDRVGAPLVLGVGDPTAGFAMAPAGPGAPPSDQSSTAAPLSHPVSARPPPPSPPPTSPPPEDDAPCLLGIIYC
jgi:Caspase domain